MERDEHDTPATDEAPDRALTESANEDGSDTPGWGTRLAIAGVVAAIGVLMLLHLTGVIGAGPH